MTTQYSRRSHHGSANLLSRIIHLLRRYTSINRPLYLLVPHQSTPRQSTFLQSKPAQADSDHLETRELHGRTERLQQMELPCQSCHQSDLSHLSQLPSTPSHITSLHANSLLQLRWPNLSQRRNLRRNLVVNCQSIRMATTTPITIGKRLNVLSMVRGAQYLQVENRRRDSSRT